MQNLTLLGIQYTFLPWMLFVVIFVVFITDQVKFSILSHFMFSILLYPFKG